MSSVHLAGARPWETGASSLTRSVQRGVHYSTVEALGTTGHCLGADSLCIFWNQPCHLQLVLWAGLLEPLCSCPTLCMVTSSTPGKEA